MEHDKTTNRLALTSLLSGLVVPITLAIYWAWLALAFPASPAQPSALAQPGMITIMDLTVTLRNLCAPVAILTGVLTLRRLRRGEDTRREKVMAWVGIVLGVGWILFGLLVGLLFLVGEALH
jgi:ABC-type sulfate transport system permease subunit